MPVIWRRACEIPIVHANADDPEACLSAVKFAVEYRKRFNKDFLIDLIGYRRYGHNEMDEPSTTQPMLYEAVRKHPTVKRIFAEKLVSEGLISEEKAQNIETAVTKRIEDAYKKVPAKKKTPYGKLNCRNRCPTVFQTLTQPLTLMFSAS
ncbi:thiamine pyrophosphate-dependent enzyme [Bacillus velezensis]|nr:thiamine pyrophosphate-dependent enzyme [Bacillus velezensis]